MPTEPGPGAPMSDNLASVPLPAGNSNVTFEPLDWNTALCKPSKVIA